MRIYYIKNGKCVDVIDKLNVVNKVMAYTAPALMTGERLIDYYARVSHGNIPETCSKLFVEYLKFAGDVWLIPHNLTLGRLIDGLRFYYVSDAMNLLIGGL